MTNYVKVNGAWKPANYTTAVNDELFTTVGTTSFVVPVGVTRISAVVVGGGGGGAGTTSGGGGGYGGDLRWARDITVTPEETLTVIVGAGGAGGTTVGTAGSQTQIKRGGTVLLSAAGGSYGSNESNSASSKPAPRAQNGTSTAISLPNIGGGTGGQGGWEEASAQGGGGGGAAGYSGNGGIGGDADEGATYESITGTRVNPAPGIAGTGGAGGGGGAGATTAGGGGGVGLYGTGANGTGGAASTQGGGGSAGSGGAVSSAGALYGGGGGGIDASGNAGSGAQGAARIIWGTDRYYPLSAQDVPAVESTSARHYVKVDGAWVEATHGYVKVDGEWRLSFPVEISASTALKSIVVASGTSLAARITPGQTYWAYDEGPVTPYEKWNPIVVVAESEDPACTVEIKFTNPVPANSRVEYHPDSGTWSSSAVASKSYTTYMNEYGSNVIDVRITTPSGVSSIYTVYFEINNSYTNNISYYGYCKDGELLMGSASATTCTVLKSQFGNPIGWVCGTSPTTVPVCAI